MLFNTFNPQMYAKPHKMIHNRNRKLIRYEEPEVCVCVIYHHNYLLVTQLAFP